MKKMGIIIFFFPFSAKTQNLIQLYKKAFEKRDFVYTNPLTSIDLTNYPFHVVFEGYIDSSRYQQLYANGKNADSSIWTNKEVGNRILVNNEGKILKWETLKTKFNNPNKKEENYYKEEIEYYNRYPQDRIIYRISRPIFDNRKEYALIQYQVKADCILKLFKIKNGNWEELFTILPGS